MAPVLTRLRGAGLPAAAVLEAVVKLLKLVLTSSRETRWFWPLLGLRVGGMGTSDRLMPLCSAVLCSRSVSCPNLVRSCEACEG